MIECPECNKEWPDTYGVDGGRRKRVLHLYAKHGEGRGRPINKIERL